MQSKLIYVSQDFDIREADSLTDEFLKKQL